MVDTALMERVAHLRLEPASADRPTGAPEMKVTLYQMNEAAFQRELPALLDSDLERWVAYKDGRRIGVFSTYDEAYEASLAAGLSKYDCFVRLVLPADEAHFCSHSA